MFDTVSSPDRGCRSVTNRVCRVPDRVKYIDDSQGEGGSVKQVNFLGHMFNIMEDDDVTQAAEEGDLHHYVVVRVADTEPGVGSPDLLRRRRRTPCESCGQICWMDPKSFDSMAGMRFMITCAQCMVHKVRTEKPPKH